MCEPNEIVPANTQLEQDLRELGWRPVEMVEPNTGTPFTRWFPPGKPIPSIYWQFVADHMDFPPNDAEPNGFVSECEGYCST